MTFFARCAGRHHLAANVVRATVALARRVVMREQEKRTVAFQNGQRVERLAVYMMATTPMFGRGVFDRLRADEGVGGVIRVFDLHGHMQRTCESVAFMFRQEVRASALPAPQTFMPEWNSMILSAVREFVKETGVRHNIYIHFGVGNFDGSGATLQSMNGGIGTVVHVEELPPLYGDALYVSSEPEYLRPQGPLMSHKCNGAYNDLLELKIRARERAGDKPRHAVEALLFSDYSAASVAEFGCSNAGAFRNGMCLFSSARRFKGRTEAAVSMLVQMHMDRYVEQQLTRYDVQRGGFAMGTAGGITPVVWVDGVTVDPPGEIAQLQRFYDELRRGELPESARWTTEVPL